MSKLRSSAGAGHLQLDVDECPQCGGAGEVKHDILVATCPACEGVGRYRGEERDLCANCSGTGQLLEGGRCPICGGGGFQHGARLALRHVLLAAPPLGLLAWVYAAAEGFDPPFLPLMAVCGALFVGGVALQIRHRRHRARLNANREAKPKRLRR